MDKSRINSKFEELDNYLEELYQIKPRDFEEYENSIEKKRACERLLQISIECVIDICNLMISQFKVGIPSDEDDLFKKLKNKNIITQNLSGILIEMKGFRNLLVHRYGDIDDEKVFEILSEKLEDFEKFKKEILFFLKKGNKSR